MVRTACEAFSLTEIIWFCLYSSWIRVDDIKYRSQEKHVKLYSKFNSPLYQERSSLFQCSLNHFQASKLSPRPLYSIKVTSENLSLVSCFVKSNFSWQSAEIRLPYHLGFMYVKWLALKIVKFLVRIIFIPWDAFIICKMSEKPGQLYQKCLIAYSVAVIFGRSRILPLI